MRDYDTSIEALSEGRLGWSDTPKCCNGSIVGFDPESRRISVIPLTCGKWSCPDCAARKAAKHARRMFAANPERHITLGWNPKFSNDPAEALKQMKKALPKFVAAVRKLPGFKNGVKVREDTIFEYCATWELHRSGFPHIHLAQWGDYVPAAELSRLWCKFTGAYIVYIKDMSASFMGGHHWTKYLLKEFANPKTIFAGMRLITFSQGYDRNVVQKPPQALGPKTFWIQVFNYPENVVGTLKRFLDAVELTIDRQDILVCPEHAYFPTPDDPMAYALTEDNFQHWYANVHNTEFHPPPQDGHHSPNAEPHKLADWWPTAPSNGQQQLPAFA
jgi:hypothetical protein